MKKPLYARSRDRHLSGDGCSRSKGSKIARPFYMEHAPNPGNGWTRPHVVHDSFPDLVESVLGHTKNYETIKDAMKWGAYKVGPGPITSRLTGYDVGDVLYVLNAAGVTKEVRQYPRELIEHVDETLRDEAA